MKNKKTTKYIIYSHNLHDNILISLVNILTTNCNIKDFTLIVILPRKKLKRVIDQIDMIDRDSDKKLEFVKTLTLIPHNGKLTYKLINFLMLILNLIKTLRSFYRADSIIFSDYGYDKNDRLLIYILGFLQSNVKIYFLLHDLIFFEIHKLQKNEIKRNPIGYLVLSENLNIDLSKLTIKKVFTFPYAVPNEGFIRKRKEFLKNSTVSGLLKIAIIGAVDNDRCEYYQIIETLNSFPFSYRLCFLGKIIDFDILEFSKKNVKNLRFFEHYLSNEELEKELIDTHYLINWTNNDMFYRRKISGSMYDAVKYGIPIITNNQNFSIKYNHALIFYEFIEIIEYLKNFSHESYVKFDGFKAIKNSMKMDLNNICIDFFQFIEN